MQYSDAADQWLDAHPELDNLFEKHAQENPSPTRRQTFPDARAFHRPGFDDQPQP